MRIIEMANYNGGLAARIEVRDKDSYNGYREIGKIIIDDSDDREHFQEIRDSIEG